MTRHRQVARFSLYESGRAGDAPLPGFSPRKPGRVIYLAGCAKATRELISTACDTGLASGVSVYYSLDTQIHWREHVCPEATIRRSDLPADSRPGATPGCERSLAPGAELPSVRDLAVRHAVNPMTISKAYSLLEAEGLLERNRGRPMTVASQAKNSSQLSKRLQQVQPLVEQTVLAAKQLELSETDLLKSVRQNWENGDE